MNKTFLLFICLCELILCFPLNHRASKYNLESRVDKKIPLIPIMVWPYISYYIFIVLGIILAWNTNQITFFLIAHIYGAGIASIIWWIFPNGVIRSKLNKNIGN